jgi:uncharacterized protein (UPF0261 family)
VPRARLLFSFLPKALTILTRRSGGVYDPEGHATFLKVLRRNLNPAVRFVELDMHINDQAFAEKAVALFDEM